MSYLILYSLGIFITSCIFSLAAGLKFIKIGGGILAWRLFGWFWIAASIIWLSFIIRIFYFWQSNIEVGLITGTLNQALIWLQVIIGISFSSLLLIRRIEIVKIIIFLLLIIALLFFYLFVFYDIKNIQGPVQTDWGDEYQPVGFSSIIFAVIAIIGILSFFAALIVKIIRYSKTKILLDQYYIYALASMIIYSLAGALENFGWPLGWKMLLVRIIILLPSFTVYLMATGESFKTITGISKY